MTDPTRPRAPRVPLLPLVGAVLLLLVGSSLLVSSPAEGPGVAVLGALMVGLALCLAAMQVARVRAGRVAAPPRLGTSPEGLPMVSVVAGGTRVASALVAIGGTALATLALAVLAFASDDLVVGVVLSVLAAAAAAYLVVPVARGLRSARVEMTPQWLAVERFGARWQVPWTDVGGSVPPQRPGQPLAVVAAGAGLEHRAGWPGWQTLPDAPPGVLAVPVEDLPVHPAVLARVVALCADDPALRAQLGSPDSADWTRWPPRG